MANMKDIAVAAGVSQSTVSFVLSGRYQKDLKISPEVVQKVKDVAAKLHYRRNAVASAMQQGRTNIVGFIGNFGEVGHSYVLRLLNGVSKALQNRGYLLKMFSLDGFDFADICRLCVEQQLCGVITRFLSQEQDALLRQEMSTYNIPVIMLGNSFSDGWCAKVVSDDVAGSILAVDHLVSLGHQRIGFLTQRSNWCAFDMRAEGYSKGLAKNKLSAPSSDFLYFDQDLKMTEDDYLGVDDYYQNYHPTALICASDILAMKLLIWAHKRKIGVPEKLSVVGFGNIDNSILTSPPLTTIAHPYEAMGQRSVEKLLELVEHKTRQKDELLPVELVIRETTASCC